MMKATSISEVVAQTREVGEKWQCRSFDPDDTKRCPYSNELINFEENFETSVSHKESSNTYAHSSEIF